MEFGPADLPYLEAPEAEPGFELRFEKLPQLVEGLLGENDLIELERVDPDALLLGQPFDQRVANEVETRDAARTAEGAVLINENGIQNADAEDGNWFIRDGIIVVPKNGVIQPGARV